MVKKSFLLLTTIVECNKNFESNKNPNEFDTALSTYILIVNYDYENKSQFITSARNELTSIYDKVKDELAKISEEAESLNQETFMSNYERLKNVYVAYNNVYNTYQNSVSDLNFNDMSTLLLEIHGKLDSAYAKYNTEEPPGDTSEEPPGDTSEEPSGDTSEGPSEGESDTIE